MFICICLDEKNGMMFNNRRQSCDSAVVEKILALAGNNNIYMSEYSAKIFPERENIRVCDDLFQAKQGDFVFVENGIESLESVETIYAFRWNRHYPGDVYFKFDLAAEGFVLQTTEEFTGTSHEKITLNIYEHR